jgi:hypothetical protein
LFSIALLVTFGAPHGTSAAGHAISRAAQVTLIARMPDDVTMLLPSAAVGASFSAATPHSALQFDFVGHLLPGASVTAACRAESGRIAIRSQNRDVESRLPGKAEFACDGRFRTLSPDGRHAATVELSVHTFSIHNRAVDDRLDLTLSVI